MDYILFKDGHQKEIIWHNNLELNVFSNYGIGFRTADGEDYLYKEWTEETFRGHLFPSKPRSHQFYKYINGKWVAVDNIKNVAFEK